jgi:hypothetical protein
VHTWWLKLLETIFLKKKCAQNKLIVWLQQESGSHTTAYTFFLAMFSIPREARDCASVAWLVWIFGHQLVKDYYIYSIIISADGDAWCMLGNRNLRYNKALINDDPWSMKIEPLFWRGIWDFGASLACRWKLHTDSDLRGC